MKFKPLFLNVKLKYIQEDIDSRRYVANYYLENIKNEKIILPKLLEKKQHVWHLFVIRTKYRDELREYLLDNEIETLIHYPIPPYKQKCYEHLKYNSSLMLNDEVLSIPLNKMMSKDEIQFCVKILNKF